MMVIMALATTVMAVPLLKMIYPFEQPRPDDAPAEFFGYDQPFPRPAKSQT
jgi:hypothetical protein